MWPRVCTGPDPRRASERARLQECRPATLASTPGKLHNVRLGFELVPNPLIVDCGPLDVGDCTLNPILQCRLFPFGERCQVRRPLVARRELPVRREMRLGFRLRPPGQLSGQAAGMPGSPAPAGVPGPAQWRCRPRSAFAASRELCGLLIRWGDERGGSSWLMVLTREMGKLVMAGFQTFLQQRVCELDGATGFVVPGSRRGRRAAA